MLASRRNRLPILGLLLPFAGVVLATNSTSLSWKSPLAGSYFSPSDILNATWTSSQSVVSPSIQLCVVATANSTSQTSGTSSASKLSRRKKDKGEEDSPDNSSEPPSDSTSAVQNNCGTAVWPTVSVDDSGESRASLSIPELSDSSTLYLLMKSDAGTIFRSPKFTVLAAGEAKPALAAELASSPPSNSTTGSKASVDATVPTLSASLGASALTAAATASASVPLKPIGPIVPAFDPAASGTASVPYPSAPVLPVQTLTAQDAAAKESSKNGRVLAVAVAVPLALMALAGIIGATSCFALRRKRADHEISSSSSISTISSTNTLVDGENLLKHQHSSSSSSSDTAASVLSSDSSASRGYQPTAIPLHQLPSYFLQAQFPGQAPYPNPSMSASTPYRAAGPPSPPYMMPQYLPPGHPLAYAQHGMPMNFMPVAGAPYMPGVHQLSPPAAAPVSPPRPPMMRSLTSSDPSPLAEAKRRESLRSVVQAHVQATTSVPPPVAVASTAPLKLSSVSSPPQRGTALTPPAFTDSEALSSMQGILDSYMAQQRDMEYRDSKPMPPLPPS